MKRTVIFIFLISMLLSCSSNEEQNTQVRIRLSNVSEFNYENVRYSTESSTIELDVLNANETSPFEIFEMAYELAFIEIEVDGEYFALAPVDLLGEVPLSNGDYTYEIDFNTELVTALSLSTRLIRE